MRETFLKTEPGLPTALVLMPVYNVENFISKSLDSVFEQTYPNVCLILINDASDDGTEGIIHKYLEEHSEYSNKIFISKLTRDCMYTH